MKVKSNIKSWVSIIVVIALLFAVAAVFVSFSGNSRTTIKSGKFSRGSLDSNGKYVETNQSIYTKDAFGCMGLRIVPDFEFKGTYDVFYFDYNDNFIEAKTGLDTIYDEDYPLAMMARIVIHPDVPAGENVSEFKIKWHQVNNYANQFNITVNNNQEWIYESDNLFVSENAKSNRSFGFPVDEEGIIKDWDRIEFYDSDTCKISGYIPVTYKNYHVYIKNNSESIDWVGAVVIASQDNLSVIAKATTKLASYNADDWIKLEISVEGELSEDYMLIAKMALAADCYIFGYN